MIQQLQHLALEHVWLEHLRNAAKQGHSSVLYFSSPLCFEMTSKFASLPWVETNRFDLHPCLE